MRSVLQIADKLLRRRKFSQAITVLESRSEFYEDNFEFYLMLGISYLYLGDMGMASAYFQRARKIKLVDSRLQLGQAAIFLRRGDTAKATIYYTDIIDDDPGNKVALQALEFIRTKGDYNTICQWADTGRIEMFYPPLGISPTVVPTIFLTLLASGLCAFFVCNVLLKQPPVVGPRADLTEIALSSSERRNAVEEEDKAGNYRYKFTSDEIDNSYGYAIECFQNGNDNAAQVELNKIVNSNAAFSIKQKAYLFMGFLKDATFDTIESVQTNYSFQDVQKDIQLYQDCVIAWSGRVSNATVVGETYACELLVGYEDLKSMQGIVPVVFEPAPVPEINVEAPVKILAKIFIVDGKLTLKGLSVFQSVTGSVN